MDAKRLFDAEYYIARYPDVPKIDPFEHFLSTGWHEGKNPHPLFDTSRYLDWYPEVRLAGVNPLLHFVRYGITGYKPHLLFDTMRYLHLYPEVKNSSLNPLVHYIEKGGFEGCSPHLYFDSAFYLDKYPDVRKAGTNPLVHFVTRGHREGKLSHPLYFDPILYVEARGAPKLSASALEDYLIDGIPDPIRSPFNYMNTPEFRVVCRSEAARFAVAPDVHPHDFTMAYAIFHEEYEGKPEVAVKYYFADGRRSSELAAKLIHQDLGFHRGPIEIMEFASGYGRVSRHWKRFTDASVTTCDIHQEAVEFNKSSLGIHSIQSVTDPDDFRPPQQYDVIFCLSFFTHMPSRTWERWLGSLFRSLSPGGVLIFTTHGDTSARLRNIDGDKNELYFTTETEQYDIDTADYGYTITRRAFVERAISKIDGAKLEIFYPDYFWDIQDVYALRRVC